ncbi:TrpR like protein, YerC/YecD [Sphingomonas sp. HDW15A]|uniref:YerC/YecD family TrpR-related protein n=1 Tax=Sphingomonas sp. HDW15A TaxID=2714942 RepID=UPI00140D4875|nr:YerC/YecD family TrpR-related protein [Sphingomonas sp. HDW15A]QIK95524.1 TrpR like protein, YerC/YecD [Sphingomonas sp. HDW15A]
MSLSDARTALADDLAVAIAAIDTAEEARAFLADLCTPAEIHALAERWYVARLLDQGAMTYREIHDATGVSTTTVVRVARFLKQEVNGGYRRVLDRLRGAA